MNVNPDTRCHWSFWLIAAVTLIWNVLGCINFVMQMNSEVVAQMAETHRAIIAGRPWWATAAFALAVFGGAAGCLLLLLKKSVAFHVLIASLLGVVVTMIHTLGIPGLASSLSPFEMVMMVLMPLVVAVFLVWYAWQARTRGWIR